MSDERVEALLRISGAFFGRLPEAYIMKEGVIRLASSLVCCRSCLAVEVPTMELAGG